MRDACEDGVIRVADLAQATTDPASLVDDLLAVDDALKTEG